MKNLKTHLDSVDESYVQHMAHALSFTWAMLRGSLYCLVHAFLPFVFEKQGSQIINTLHDRMVVNRANLTPAKTDAAVDSIEHSSKQRQLTRVVAALSVLCVLLGGTLLRP